MPTLIRHPVPRPVLLGFATLFLSVPAVYNGLPLLFFDSFDYLGNGRRVLRALATGREYGFYGYRSHFYSLFLGTMYATTHSLWIVPLVQGLILSYILWLCFRVVSPGRPAALFLGQIGLLSCATSASWFVSFVMPDVFAAILILAAFLLGPGRRDLGRGERGAVLAVALVSILVHASHFALAAALTIPVLVIACVERRPGDGWVSSALLGGLVAVAVLLTAGMTAMLYGRPGLYRDSPPFLLARSIGDGPGRAFIREQCGRTRYAICAVADDLPTTASQFLWGDRSILKTGSPDLVRQIHDEELALVLGATRQYPLWQLRQSLGNFARQLLAVDLYSFEGRDDYDQQVSVIMRRQQAAYLRSRQHTRTLPLRALTSMHQGILWAAFAVSAWVAYRAWRLGRSRLVELAVIVGFGVVSNAWITGVFSNVLGRYQARVAWLAVAVGLQLFGIGGRTEPSPGEGGHERRDPEQRPERGR
jgi:hypothetical protein